MKILIFWIQNQKKDSKHKPRHFNMLKTPKSNLLNLLKLKNILQITKMSPLVSLLKFVQHQNSNNLSKRQTKSDHLKAQTSCRLYNHHFQLHLLNLNYSNCSHQNKIRKYFSLRIVPNNLHLIILKQYFRISKPILIYQIKRITPLLLPLIKLIFQFKVFLSHLKNQKFKQLYKN